MNAEIITFVIAAAVCVVGALGVVLARNPVHSALFLVQTLFGVAVLFIAKEAYFLAAIQVVVYAGAIVILFLFVIMLVGVDKAESLEVEPVVGLRPVAVVLGAALLAGLVTVILSVREATGVGILPMDPERFDINQLGDRLFTDWVFAFELTALLLTIAVVGAVVLARRATGELEDLPDPAPLIADFVPDASDDADGAATVPGSSPGADGAATVPGSSAGADGAATVPGSSADVD
ncbi:MAG: NADH-quinone oxidoreductase subunit J, partial [Acidimicrobiia bacterium]|nr:NADH-quinone oxidoreductase subunit J [Acidimicrobiia bacterium]